MTSLQKAGFEFGIMQLVLGMAEKMWDQRNMQVPASAIYFDADSLITYAKQNFADRTDLLLALAPAVEQCRNGMNDLCERYAQRLTAVCMTQQF